jgi:glycosyl transferase family 87
LQLPTLPTVTPVRPGTRPPAGAERTGKVQDGGTINTALRWLVGAFLVAVLALHVVFLWGIWDRVRRGDPDFTVYYTAALMLRQGMGAQLYDPDSQLEIQRQFTSDSDIRRGPLPYIHPPFEALFFLPLTFLHYPAAYAVWNLVNLGMLVWAVVILRGCLPGLAGIPLGVTILAALAFFPVLANFHQGQDAILLLLLCVLAFSRADRCHYFVAGCWLGLGAFKFQFVVPLALLWTCWLSRTGSSARSADRSGVNDAPSWHPTNWMAMASGFMIVAGAAAGLSVAMVGWSQALRYPAFSWRIISSVRLGGLPARSMPNLVGLICGWPATENAEGARIAAVIFCCVIFVLVASLKAPDSQTLHLAIACAVITSVLISYNTNTYDLALLILPLGLLADYALRSSAPAGTAWRLFLPSLPLLISPLWFFLWLVWLRTNLMGLFLVAWLFFIWREARYAELPYALTQENRIG